MTEEELKEKIADIIDREDKNSFALPCMDIANQILTLIRESGWKSPEECQTCWLHNYETMLPTTSIK